jgi:hypothetical protein
MDDDTFKQLGFTGPDGKPDQARMQEHILRCVWDLIKARIRWAGCPSFELARACVFGALRCLSDLGGREPLIWTPGPQSPLLLQRIGRR